VAHGLLISAPYIVGELKMKKLSKVDKQTIIAYGIFCTVSLVILLIAGSWGRHATSIPFLKLAQITGTASADTLDKIVVACTERAKWDCAQKALVDLYEKTNDVETVAKLADMQRKLGFTQNALATYAAYSNVGGKNPEHFLKYAELLEKSGNIEGAISAYTNAFVNAGDRLPVRAMTGIVRNLMAERRYEEAQAKIKEFQASASNAENYFNEEADQLPLLIKNSKRMAAR
jgi:tetratricopeptide (TPR) repeat protein